KRGGNREASDVAAARVQNRYPFLRIHPMTTLQLYYAPGACSFVPHVALEAAKAEFEPKLVKLHKGEQKTPEYLALNPNGQVPVLVVDGRALTQIMAIVAYLVRQFPDAGLLPAE